jgi:uncharacterized protein (DUF1501 family)
MSPLSRRALLGGALGGGLLAGLGVPRARAADDRYLLVYWHQGGWDPAFVFDPHFESDIIHRGDTTERGTAGELTFGDAVSRPSVRSFFERWGERSAIVNGISVGSIAHDVCTRALLTGARSPDAADLATRLSVATGSTLGAPYGVISGPRFPGAHGEVVVPINDVLGDILAGRIPTARDATDEAKIQAWLAEELDALPEAVRAQTRVAQYADGLARLPTLQAWAAGATVPAAPTEAERLAIAVGLLSDGLSRAVAVQGSLPQQAQWDSHQVNDRSQDLCFENAFSGLVTLMGLLDSAAAPGGGVLADRTLVLVLSEMGRTPVLNASLGKDHWPWTSALLIGAGVAGGRSLGGTDAGMAGMGVDPETGDAIEGGEPLTPPAFAAGILEQFDVDPESEYPGVTPFRGPFV